MDYKRRQYGSLTIGSILIIVAILASVSLLDEEPGGSSFLTILVVAFTLMGLLFMSLTVRVEAAYVRLSFGVGLVRRKIPMERIESVNPVRNSWWYGLGIRLTPHGWMWNIQGLDAVELTYVDGGRFRIGTADPEGLSAAINDMLPSWGN
jgi:hypothetical protein